jgi:hypothetical protein
LHTRISPSTSNWISTGAGKSGLSYDYGIRMGDAQVELYIDRGDAEENKHIFDALYTRREEIEQVFGDRLEWQRLDDRRASRIRYLIPSGGLKDQDRWPEIQERMIDAMIRLERALAPTIRKLK